MIQSQLHYSNSKKNFLDDENDKLAALLGDDGSDFEEDLKKKKSNGFLDPKISSSSSSEEISDENISEESADEVLEHVKKSFKNNELLESNWRKQWRDYLGDPPPKKYVEDWIVFQKAKWEWQRQPEPLKISLFTKKSFKNNELESNYWRKKWRVYLGDPPPIKYIEDWIVFQKAKWDWQREPEPEEEEPEPENVDEQDEQDEEEERRKKKRKEKKERRKKKDEETRNFDIRAKNKIFNIFANVIGSLAISNNTDEVAVKKDVNQELHEDLMDGLKEKNIITDDQIYQIATEVEENEDLETNADRDQYMQNAVSREIFHGFANLHNIPVEKRKYFKDSVNEEDSST